MLNRIKQISLSVVLAAGLLLTGCGSSKMDVYVKPSSSYSAVTSVDGIKFAVPSKFIHAATSISEITENNNFSEHTAYVMQDDPTKYMLFCMDTVVISVQKGTNFGFYNLDSDTIEQGLEQGSVNGILCNKDGKKFSYETSSSGGILKLVGKVTAQVVITKNLYGDFHGELAVLYDGNTEYGLFVGVPDSIEDTSGTIEETLNTVAGTLSTYTAQAGQDSGNDYAVVVDNGSTQSSASDGEGATESTAEASTENSTAGITENATQESTESIAEANTESPVEATTEAPAEAGTSESTESEIADTEIPAENTSESTTESAAETSSKDDKTEVMPAFPENKIKDSTAKTPLSLKDAGTISAKASSGKGYIELGVQLYSVSTGDAVNKTIAEYAKNANRQLSAKAPVGTYWVMGTYRVDTGTLSESELPYIQINLKGTDGNDLKQAGVAYSDRTYDMGKQSDGLYAFYFAVPYNCDSYMMVFGDGTPENGYKAAYYLIQQNDVNDTP